MKLSFRDLKQNKFTIEAEPSDLISEVKQRIADEKGWDASTLKLIYSGKILQDANTVESYKIEEKGFIVCMTAKPKVTPAVSTSASVEKVQVTSSTNLSKAHTPSSTGDTSSGSISTSSSSAGIPVGLTSTGISMGAERAAQISELESMGFERSQIDTAMRAAFYNSERAVEYLLNGIPENLLPNVPQSASTGSSTNSSAPTQGQSSDQEGISRNLFDVAAALGSGTTGGGGLARGTSTNTPSGGNSGGLGNLDFLRNNPQFQQLRQVVQQQPHMLEPILQQVGAGNPQLAALIGDHSQQFLQLLSEEGENDGALPPGVQAITITEDERAAIERLCLLGFSRDLATQAYFACEKNEELAANFLLEQPDEEQ
ncbi:UV excision repair protein rhp23 [Erysiphe neolycopersici]|uniref:UV excision repair protein RAD23 n=1 Tax=Erysiphe neolycopersici TaxID=212602 RepID=A0A420I0J4_9PEZI|nr:UV excision repair protein rhp23 [Erysiphe neolycopersici]